MCSMCRCIPVNFINFIVIPLFTQLVELSPSLKECLEMAKKNLDNWNTYVETDADKKVYLNKTENTE